MAGAWGRFVYRHRAAVPAATGVVLALALVALLRGGTLTTGSISGTEAYRAQRIAERDLRLPGEASFQLVFRSERLTLDDPEYRAALERALAPLAADPEVASVVSPASLQPPFDARFVSADRHSVFAVVTMKGDVKRASQLYPGLRERVRGGPLEVTATGHLAFMHDLDRTLERDLLRAEAVSLPLALVVLLLVFGSVAAALLPVLVGGLAVTCGLGAVMALSRATDMAQYTLNVTSLIGLGVAIDYSLFIVSRFRDELHAGLSVEDALARSLSTAGRAVAFSGLAVGVGLAGLLFFRGSYLASMGLAGAVVVAFAMLFALTFLPALLALLGPRVDWGRVRGVRRVAGRGAWHALALRVMRHPVAVLVPTLAFLLLLGAPFLRLELAAADVTVLPASAEARRGWERMREHFPTVGANRVLALVEFPSGSAFTPARVQALYDFSRAVAQRPGVLGVESIVDLDERLDRDTYAQLAAMAPQARPPQLTTVLGMLVAGPVTMLQIAVEGEPPGPDAQRLVRWLRAQGRVGDGTLLVGGRTAADLDAAAYVRERTPYVVAFVVALIGAVLFLLLGSVVLPLKAVVMNLLSVAGSFGAMVWVFQDGHLSGLLGFEPRPLEPAMPVLLFCFVFGLSMDYEVLLLSRMQEEYARTRDNTAAVALGLEKSAGLITSAAAIMVAVFSAFALATIVMVKSMGVGLAVAVALDATLVRVLLVPATMRLFGDLNWWVPRPLARLRSLLHAGPAPAPRRT